MRSEENAPLFPDAGALQCPSVVGTFEASPLHVTPSCHAGFNTPSSSATAGIYIRWHEGPRHTALHQGVKGHSLVLAA